jgi:hypothetical protein
MNKRQKKKLKKQHGSRENRNQSKTERNRLSTMVIADRKKAESKKQCRGKINEADKH